MPRLIDFLPAAEANKRLCLVVRSAYIRCRRRFDSINDKAATYAPAPAYEAKTPTPYESFIRKTLRYRFNPIQFMMACMDRSNASILTSDAPMLEHMTKYNLFDPCNLDKEYVMKAKTAIKTAESAIASELVLFNDITGTSDVVSFIEDLLDQEIYDPVTLLVKCEEFSIVPKAPIVDAARIAFAVSPDAYRDKFGAKKALFSKWNFTSFSQWDHEQRT
jgi:hypothetical protein